MKLSLMGRIAMATLASLALGLGMSACGGGTIGYMWVLGDQYNQITGLKIDDFTGNLTQVIGSPFSSNGVNPVSIVVKPGGRYVYVINQGAGDGSSTKKATSSGIALYSVGGDGVLTFQQAYSSQGNIPVWAQFDSSGSYLYVLDKYSGQKDKNGNPDTVGAITAFATDSSTGRLTVITNTAILDSLGNPTPNFRVGNAPIMMKTAGSCLFTLDSAGDNTVFPYSFGANGQLTITTPGSIPTGVNSASSINGSGSTIYLTDLSTNYILPFTVQSGCGLMSLVGGNVKNFDNTANPVYSLVDNSNKYFYVLNQSTTSTGTTQPYSSISAFVLNPSNGQLEKILSSPYKVGSNPVCMVEDPSGQYMYVSNRNDGTVSGFLFNPTTGELSDLTRGSTFPASGLGGCLADSGAVD